VSLQRKLDGFASQKNFSIDQAKNDWVFILNADESLSDELQESIKQLDLNDDIEAYRIARRSYPESKWLAYDDIYPDCQIKLFNRQKVSFGMRKISEFPEVKGRLETIPGDIIHPTYENVADHYRKIVKYAKLEADWTKTRPRYRSAVKEFLVRYIKQSGSKKGWAGLINALLMAYYRLVVRQSINE